MFKVEKITILSANFFDFLDHLEKIEKGSKDKLWTHLSDLYNLHNDMSCNLSMIDEFEHPDEQYKATNRPIVIDYE